MDFFSEDLLRGDTLNLTEGDFTRDVLHDSASVTKSVTSLLFGIAIDQGAVSGTDATLTILRVVLEGHELRAAR